MADGNHKASAGEWTMKCGDLAVEAQGRAKALELALEAVDGLDADTRDALGWLVSDLTRTLDKAVAAFTAETAAARA